MGRKVMEVLIEICKNKGIEGIELSTTVDNDRAYALYEKVGFTFIKEVETFLGDGSVRVERCMFLPLKNGAQPMSEPHRSPV
jgi:ribosomal protein S18 acetylase RimI-like enzyme